MKIVRVIARLNVGGPARHVALLNAGLDAHGHDTLLVYGALDAGEASLEAPAVESGIRLSKEPFLGRSVNPLSDLRTLISLVRTLFREQPDVVHTHTAKAGTLGRLAAFAYNRTRGRQRRALVVHTFHGHVFEGYFSPTVNRLVRLTERWLARLTDVVITISPRQQDDIVRRFAVAPSSKTVVVPLGLDLDALFAVHAGSPDLRHEYGAAPGDVVVGYVGRLVPVKDVPTLLRAFAVALGSAPHLRLVVAGDGTERDAVESLTRELGIGARVHFARWVSDLPRFYASIDVFVLSSVNEGTPVAAIEAMAAGRPVVATSVGGVPDVVEDGRTGWLVPARDERGLAGAFVRLAETALERERFGQAGRERAQARYAHTRLVSDIEQLYTRELARRRGGR